MSDARTGLVEEAKWLEEAGRYEDMAATMKNVIQMSADLSNEERSMFSVAYEQVLAARLKARRVFVNIEQKLEGSKDRQLRVIEFREKIEREISAICTEVLGLLDVLLNGESCAKPMYEEMKVVYGQHLAEVTYREDQMARSSPPLSMQLPQHSPSGSAEQMECFDASPTNKADDLPAAPFDKLPESLLAKIFTYLPFKDRYEACCVSTAWVAASRIPWSDVTFLDLGTVPRAMVDSILALCPKLQVLVAKDLIINLAEMQSALPVCASLHTLKLRNVKFDVAHLSAMEQTRCGRTDLLGEYFRRFPKLTELIWQNVTVFDPETGSGGYHLNDQSDGIVELPPITAESIRRLILIPSNNVPRNEALTISTMELTNLECFYTFDSFTSYMRSVETFFKLSNLREVCLSGDHLYLGHLLEALSLRQLPKLEVLIVASQTDLRHQVISKLLQTCKGLRVLAIAGGDERLAMEEELRVLAGEPVTPVVLSAPAVGRPAALKPLEIFVGGDFTQRVRFSLPKPFGLANFRPIDCPMPAFLAKPGVAEIFKDAWVAEVIREGPDTGVLPWANPNQTNLFHSTSPLSFC